jgi:hypothetical protein
MGGTCSMRGDIRNTYNILFDNSHWKKARGRPRCRWEDNTKTDHPELGCEDWDWIHLARYRIHFGAGFFEYDNEASSSLKAGNTKLYRLSNY